jgi:hypothetical protein
MATKKPETALTPANAGLSIFDPATGGGAMTERPSFIPAGDTTGTEGITQEDIRLPRLTIAQGLSPQLTPGDSAYIDGLKMFQLFNDFTRQIYGNGPLYFIAVRRDVRRIEFIPRDEGGGVKDMNVPHGDPRTEWTEDEEGHRVPPKATKFNEFVVLLLVSKDDPPEPIVLSIKDTNKFNRRAATDLNGFIKMHASKGKNSVPIYGVVYSISSKSEKNDNGTFGVPIINQVGFVPRQDWFQAAQAFAASLEGKNVVTTREPGDEDSFVEGEQVHDGPRM